MYAEERQQAMPTRSVVVGSAVGLHARPAAIISEAAMELDSEVLIGVPGDEPVDASSATDIRPRAVTSLAMACWRSSAYIRWPPRRETGSLFVLFYARLCCLSRGVGG